MLQALNKCLILLYFQLNILVYITPHDFLNYSIYSDNVSNRFQYSIKHDNFL